MPTSQTQPSTTGFTPGSASRPDAGVLTPIGERDRIGTLDLLRGFAMFGVLLSNLNTGYGVVPATTSFTSFLEAVQRYVIEGRFYTLLGFLFGIGFALQLTRVEAFGKDAARLYLRRLAVLLLIGLVHGLLIWRGDILTFYAIVGILLLPYRAVPVKALPWAALATFIGVSGLQAIVQIEWGLGRVPPAPSPAAASIYASGTVAQVFAQRASDFVQWYSWWTVSGLAVFLTLFVLGLWIGRTGLVQHIPERLATIRRALVVAVVCCIVGLVLRKYLNVWWPHPDSPPTAWADRVRLLPRFVAGLVSGVGLTWSMTALYTTAMTLLYQRSDAWRNRLRGLVAVGRMTLTTYIAQSIVCTLIFYSYGLGLYGRVGYTGMLVLAVVLFAVQMMFSMWWLSRYRFGPAEWLWRSLTYGERQPMAL